MARIRKRLRNLVSAFPAVLGSDSDIKFSRKFVMQEARRLKALTKKPAALIKRQALISVKRGLRFAKQDLSRTIQRIQLNKKIDQVSRFLDKL